MKRIKISKVGLRHNRPPEPEPEPVKEEKKPKRKKVKPVVESQIFDDANEPVDVEDVSFLISGNSRINC